MDESLLRHVAACANARLPGDRVPWRIGDAVVGYAAAPVAAALAPHADHDGAMLVLREPASLPGLARDFAQRGLLRWRGEAFDVKAAAGAPALTTIDRGGLPAFGVLAEGVHVNGLVRRGERVSLWVVRRAADKALDPNKLDHIVAGGVPAGLTAAETLVKEAAEEAGIPAALAAGAVWQGRIAYAMERPEGLRRDVLHIADLWLPEAFSPRPVDGEVAGFELWDAADLLAVVRETDEVKFNVNLVLTDLFIRLGLVTGEEARRVAGAMARMAAEAGA